MTVRLVITAGASGIGLAITRHFTKQGASVAICDVDANAIAAVATEFDLAQVCDVTDSAGVEEFVGCAVKKWAVSQLLSPMLARPAQPLTSKTSPRWNGRKQSL